MVDDPATRTALDRLHAREIDPLAAVAHLLDAAFGR
jgi:hypothetical protein